MDRNNLVEGRANQIRGLALRIVLDDDGICESKLAVEMFKGYMGDKPLDILDYLRMKDDLDPVLNYSKGRVYLK